MTNPQRVRVRFAKEADLRLISHRDLVRLFERMFRRVGVTLAMSQGFHPRPLMTFPDALSLGIAASNEAMDISFAEEIDPDDLLQRMSDQAPDGLVIKAVRILGDGERKAKIERVVYELNLPPETNLDELGEAIESLKKQETLTVARKEKQVELKLTDSLEGLWIEDARLMMNIRLTSQSQLQPRDILAVIGLSEVLREGATLTRTQVELSK